MKIVHCIFTMVTGGAQMLVVDILNSLSNCNDVSLIIVNDYYDSDVIKMLNSNINVCIIKRKIGSKNPIPILKLNRIVYILKPDIFHCHESNIIRLFLFKAFKTILTIHDVGIENFYENKYDKLVSISKCVSQDVNDRKNIKSTIINNGIAFEKFRRRINFLLLNTEKFYIIQVSTLFHKKKGQDILIAAVHKLVKIYKLPIDLTFIGSGDSLEFLKQMTEDLDMKSSIHFKGTQPRNWIINNLSNYHLLVQPSRYEGFGLTVVEGIAAGIPVLASNVDGPKDILDKWKNLFLFESDDVDDCVNKITTIYNFYISNEIQSKIEDVYNKVYEKYKIDNMLSGYYQIYSQLMQ